MPNVIQIAWSDNSGYSITSQPSSMLGGATRTITPPSLGCTVNFVPSIYPSGSSTAVSSYTLGGTAKDFTMPEVAGGEQSYTFNFSVDGYQGKSGANGRSIPVNRTGL